MESNLRVSTSQAHSLHVQEGTDTSWSPPTVAQAESLQDAARALEGRAPAAVEPEGDSRVEGEFQETVVGRVRGPGRDGLLSGGSRRRYCEVF